jgi:hypothetical protein
MFQLTANRLNRLKYRFSSGVTITGLQSSSSCRESPTTNRYNVVWKAAKGIETC